MFSCALSHWLNPGGSTLHKPHQCSRRLIGGTVEHQQTRADEGEKQSETMGQRVMSADFILSGCGGPCERAYVTQHRADFLSDNLNLLYSDFFFIIIFLWMILRRPVSNVILVIKRRRSPRFWAQMVNL